MNLNPIETTLNKRVDKKRWKPNCFLAWDIDFLYFVPKSECNSEMAITASRVTGIINRMINSGNNNVKEN